MLDEIQSLVMDSQAMKTVTMMLVWETADGVVHHRAIPDSPALTRGLIATLKTALEPEEEEAAEEEED